MVRISNRLRNVCLLLRVVIKELKFYGACLTGYYRFIEE